MNDIKRSFNSKKSPENSFDLLATATFLEEKERKSKAAESRRQRKLEWHHRGFQSPESRPHHLPSSYSRSAYDLSNEPNSPPPWRR